MRAQILLREGGAGSVSFAVHLRRSVAINLALKRLLNPLHGEVLWHAKEITCQGSACQGNNAFILWNMTKRLFWTGKGERRLVNKAVRSERLLGSHAEVRLCTHPMPKGKGQRH